VFSLSGMGAEYLEETRPTKPLLPKAPELRALVRAIALDIGADIQPVQNLRVLREVMGFFDDKDTKTKHKLAWGKKWIENGFDGVEAKLAKSAGKYCVGDELTIADAFLVPQVYNARRFKVSDGCVCACGGVPRIMALRKRALTLRGSLQCDMSKYPTISRVTETLEALPEFKQAHPSEMPDAA